jgi:hypothetical protein
MANPDDIHPNAPAGGGGPGNFQGAAPLGMSPNNDKWMQPAPLGLVKGSKNPAPKPDELKRLGEIRMLVEANNQSKLSTSMIICQIYKESAFDKNAGVGKHAALGLMQIQRPAAMQVYKYRLQKKTGKMPSDKDTQKAFAEARAFYDAGDILDEATNIRIGTEYMQYWLDSTATERDAYVKYRGDGGKEPYYERISECARLLDAAPNDVTILRKLHGK